MRRFLLFFLVPIVDLALLVWTAGQIGVGWTLFIVIGTALAGSLLVKRQGLAVWGEVRSRFAEGTLPARELAHGAMIVVAGAFLIAPGIITDVVGLLLLIPSVREWIRERATRTFVRRSKAGSVRVQVWR